MSDSYQAIYEATRSRINNGDVGSAVSSAIRDMNLTHYAMQAKEEIAYAAYEYMRPSVIYRPRIFRDGDKWCALYGENLHDGCIGFGDSIADAMSDFDVNWKKPVKQEVVSE